MAKSWAQHRANPVARESTNRARDARALPLANLAANKPPFPLKKGKPCASRAQEESTMTMIRSSQRSNSLMGMQTMCMLMTF
jgi:hypothetical protein